MSDHDFLLSPGEQAPQDCSEFQRFRVHVPNVKTTMSLGAKADNGGIRELDTGAPNYAGFGVDTEGHVFLSARGCSPAENQLKLQSLGEMSFVTESTLSVASNKSALIATPETVSVTGNKGVFLAAGTFLAPPSVEVPDSDTAPNTPPFLDGLPGAVDQVVNMWKLVDTGFAALEIGMVASDVALHVRETGKFPPFKAAARAIFDGYMANWGGNVSGLAGEKFDHPVTFGAEGDAIIHAEAGLILGSMGSAGLFSAIGTTIGSAVGVGIAAPIASMLSMFDTSVKSARGGTSVSAHKTLELLGGDGVEMASRRGNVAVRGKQVVLGSKAGGDKQSETKFVGAYGVTIMHSAQKALRLTAGKTAVLRSDKTAVQGTTTSITADKTLALGAKKVRIRGDKSVSIGGGDWAVQVGKSKIQIGKTAKKFPAEPGYQIPNEHEVLSCLASDTPMRALKEHKAEVDKAVAKYEKKWFEWAQKCEDLQAKDSLIELKNAKIHLKVKSSQLKITSSKLQAMKALVVK